MALYAPSSHHPELTPEAAALDHGVLVERADAAERLLGLSGTTFTGEDAVTAELAVVYRINCTVAGQQRVVRAHTEGDQRYEYAVGKDAPQTDYCTMAQQLADRLLRSTRSAASGAFRPLLGVR